jgi:uncharacterized protein YbjT (DUF2867 family)
LDGITKAYVAYYPDLAISGASETVQALFAHAIDAGVKKLVLLSGRGETEAEHAELMLKACDVDWTILRCSFFSQNFSESFLLNPILAGEVALPVRPVTEPFVDVEDIADVAVAALTQSGHSRKLYELRGPRALTFAEAIGEISRATGRDIRYLSTTPDECRAALLGAQVPGDIIDFVLYLFGTVLDGRNTPVADGVSKRSAAHHAILESMYGALLRAASGEIEMTELTKTSSLAGRFQFAEVGSVP